MINKDALKLQEKINKLQDQSNQKNKELKNIITNFVNKETKLEEIAFLHNVVSTKSVSYLCFNLRLKAYEIDEKKANILFRNSIKDLKKYEPNNFPTCKVKYLVKSIDKLHSLLRKNKKEFWGRYCLETLKTKDKIKIYDLQSNIQGEGMIYLLQVIISALSLLENNNIERYEKLLESEVIV